MKRVYFTFFLCLILQNSKASSNYETFADETFRKTDNTITVQIIRSSYPLDWSSSRSLLLSIIKNRYWFPKTKSTLGHVTVEANCTLGLNRVRIFSGQGAKNLLDFRRKILAGYGFSILNSPMSYSELPMVTVEGKLNTLEEMKPRFEMQMDRENLSVISFQVNQRNCLNAFLFMREYRRMTEKTPLAGNRYGFGADPQKFEGAGCAPYVQTVLLKAGLLEAAQAMNQSISVPKTLIGDPVKGEKVGVFQLLSSDYALDGSFEGEKYEFSFPDPELLYSYLIDNLSSGNVIDKKQIDSANSYFLMLNFRQPEQPVVDSDPSV